MSERPPRLGAVPRSSGGFEYRIWAPKRNRIGVRLLDAGPRTTIFLEADPDGHHSGVIPAEPGSRYLLWLDQRVERPDPLSRSQPEGVHGPSQLVDPSFEWTDRGWTGRSAEELAIYELHVGTFTPEGTFTAAIEHLDDLVELGITAVELMPVAQFAGRRNWGYDGVYPFAVHDSYGGLRGLQQLVDACHARRLCVLVDVVYNHLGPEGNYLADFGPYFTETYRTPWGSALNFDGPNSPAVRQLFIEHARFLLEAAHVDGFRLDAVHAIVDASAYPFVEHLTDEVKAIGAELGRTTIVIAEDASNDSRLTRTKSDGGAGMHAQWNDDLHHAIHVTLTGEQGGYYRDFTGISDVATALTDGFVYGGRTSENRRKIVGRPGDPVDPGRTVAFIQNHDQVGNRARGDRLTHLVDAENQKAAAGLVLLGPALPLVFQGEEHRDTAPFLYFVDHTDPELLRAVLHGRRAEFKAFGWGHDLPDPGDEATFAACRIDHAFSDKVGHREVRAFYGAALALRHAWRARWGADRPPRTVRRDGDTVLVTRHGGAVLLAVSFGGPTTLTLDAEGGGPWELALHSAATDFGGPGSTLPPRIETGAAVELAGPCCIALEHKDSRS